MEESHARIDELEQLATALEAITMYEEVEDTDGPWIDKSDTNFAGYAAIAQYARDRANWLRNSAS
jgi:hypothetical protein